MAVAREGSSFEIPGNTTFVIKAIDIQIDPKGYMTDWAVAVEYIMNNGKVLKDTIKPNSPSLQAGLNINVKDLQAFPEKAILLQFSKDPGAYWALVGGICFMIGVIILAVLKIKLER